MRLWKGGKSQRNTGELVKKSRATNHYLHYQEIPNYKKIAGKPRTGRPRKIESLHRRAFLRTIIQNPKISAANLSRMLQKDYSLKVDPETVRIALRAGYNSRVPLKKRNTENKFDILLYFWLLYTFNLLF